MLAPATYAYQYHYDNCYNCDYDKYENFPRGNTQFHPRDPDYYDGNLRYTLKTRADIERASSPNLHYDKYSRDYYRCNWIYNKNLGTWVCDKYCDRPKPRAQAITVCPVGYVFSQTYKTCLPESREVVYVKTQPAEIVVIEPTITYYGVRLPSTGPGLFWILIGVTSFGVFRLLHRK